MTSRVSAGDMGGGLTEPSFPWEQELSETHLFNLIKQTHINVKAEDEQYKSEDR